MAARLSTVLALVLILSLVVHGAPKRSQACSCETFSDRAESVEEQVRWSDTIVVGEIVERRLLNPSGTVWLAVVNVDLQYKGIGDRRIQFQTFADEGACGYPQVIEPGPHLLVLYRVESGALRTSYCTSFPMDRAASSDSDHAAYLNALARAAPPRVLESSTPTWAIALYICASVGSLAAIAYVGGRRSSFADDEGPSPR